MVLFGSAQLTSSTDMPGTRRAVEVHTSADFMGCNCSRSPHIPHLISLNMISYVPIIIKLVQSNIYIYDDIQIQSYKYITDVSTSAHGYDILSQSMFSELLAWSGNDHLGDRQVAKRHHLQSWSPKRIKRSNIVYIYIHIQYIFIYIHKYIYIVINILHETNLKSL